MGSTDPRILAEESAFRRLVVKNGWSGRRTVGAARKVFFQMTSELRRLAAENQLLREQIAMMVRDEQYQVGGPGGGGEGAAGEVAGRGGVPRPRLPGADERAAPGRLHIREVGHGGGEK